MKIQQLILSSLLGLLTLSSCVSLTPEQLAYRQSEYELGMQKMKSRSSTSKDFLPHLHNAAALFHSGAELALGDVYSNGKYMAPNWPEAVKWYKKSGTSELRVQQLLADVYDNGRPGVPYSAQEAIRWYKKAGNKGDTHAQARAGFLLLNTALDDYDYKEAHRWLERAGRNGNGRAREAAFRLGRDIEIKEERKRRKAERERRERDRQREHDKRMKELDKKLEELNRPSRPDSDSKPNRPSRPDGATKPDRPSRPAGATKPDRPSRPDGATKPNRPSRPDGASKPDRPKKDKNKDSDQSPS